MDVLHFDIEKRPFCALRRFYGIIQQIRKNRCDIHIFQVRKIHVSNLRGYPDSHAGHRKAYRCR